MLQRICLKDMSAEDVEKTCARVCGEKCVFFY